MIGITGIGNLNEPQVARSAKGIRDLPKDDGAEEKKDGVQISAAGTEAAAIAHFIRESSKATEIRQERVDTAKENVEQGRHRVEEVVSAVASRLIGSLQV